MNVGTGAGIGLGQLERDQREVKRLHDAYLEALDRHDGTGSPLTEWEDVPPRERQAWRAVDVLVRLRVERAETQLDLVRSERDALVAEANALRSQVRFLEVLRNQDELETTRAKLELEALRGARQREANPKPNAPPPKAPVSAPRTVKVAGLVEDKAADGLYLAVESGLEVIHPGATVRVQGTSVTVEVTDVMPEEETPIFIASPDGAFTVKAGDVLEVVTDEEQSAVADSAPLVTVKVTAVAPDEEGGGFYLAVDRGLREVHQGDAVRIQGTGMVAVVTGVEPTTPLPIFIGYPPPSFAPKEGDVLELLPKPGGDLSALIA
ncbi:hypothetical protein [Corallococcus exiguus]|uniref:Uncharacterized protein n=1 Tax=Corallococcus exiguus TaxID=83462 RepID=A0A7X4Y7N4_9BACT|nr:hypothetical protein [Corallococcus exiguus]NBC40443.1 hypothetical protein [Corallococcus exiguus]TNV64073.1 hypothetical protein FH620_13630 [Corallococcus exiguus]